VHVNDGDVDNDDGCWRIRSTGDGMWDIGVDGLAMFTWERCVSRIKAVLDVWSKDLLRDVDDVVIEQDVIEEVRRKRWRGLLDVAAIEVEWSIGPGKDLFDIREHHFPQDLNMRRVNSIFDDDVTVFPEEIGCICRQHW